MISARMFSQFCVVTMLLVATVSSFSTMRPITTYSSCLTNSNAFRPSPLFVVADPPNKEEEEIEKHNDSDDAWIESGGGFLPKLPKIKRGKPGRAGVHQVVTIQEYKSIVVEEKDKMVCVRFYAPWCKACKAIQERFYGLAREYGASVKFVEVPLTKENAYLHQGLGVPSLPYAHLYHPDVGLVEERKIKKQLFGEFKGILKTYVQGSCKVEYEDEQALP